MVSSLTFSRVLPDTLEISSLCSFCSLTYFLQKQKQQFWVRTAITSPILLNMNNYREWQLLLEIWIWGEKMFCGYVASFLESSCVFGFEPSNSLWTILEIVCDESNYSWFIFPVAVTQALGFHINDCFWYHLAAMIHR